MSHDDHTERELIQGLGYEVRGLIGKVSTLVDRMDRHDSVLFGDDDKVGLVHIMRLGIRLLKFAVGMIGIGALASLANFGTTAWSAAQQWVATQAITHSSATLEKSSKALDESASAIQETSEDAGAARNAAENAEKAAKATQKTVEKTVVPVVKKAAPIVEKIAPKTKPEQKPKGWWPG